MSETVARPVLVAIGGGTASGKTTVALGVAEALGASCLLLQHDRYYHSLPEHLRATPLGYNFDHPSSLDTPRMVADLRALAVGQPVRAPRYDFARHLRMEVEELLQPCPFIVVEGILVLADPDLRALVQHRIYVHTPDDLRLARRIRRDLQKRGRGVEDVLDQYERTVRPMHERYVAPSRAHADLELDGTRPVSELVEAVLGRIGAWV